MATGCQIRLACQLFKARDMLISVKFLLEAQTPNHGEEMETKVRSIVDISKTKFIPKYQYLKVNFLIPENLL